MKIKKTIYITLFAILYLCTAFVSTLHAISFFNLANELWLGIILACTFEIGQAAVLFSILTDKSNHKKVMPWVLMCILTLVQILGNVFSSYKYILTNSVIDLKYFKEPIFVWTDLPDNITTVIVTYIIGAVLPIVSLALTSMVTGYLDTDNKSDEAENNKQIEDLQKELDELKNKEPEVIEKEVKVDNPEQAEEIEKLKKEVKRLEIENNHLPDIEGLEREKNAEIDRLNKEIEELKNQPDPEPEVVEKEVIKEVQVDNPEQAAEIERLNKKIADMEADKNNKNDKESHFVNL